MRAGPFGSFGGAGRERLVLALGLGCAFALAVAAASSLGDPDHAQTRALERLVASLVESVRAEWRALARSGAPGVAGSAPLEWPVDLDRAHPSAPPRGLLSDDPAGSADFALVFAAATRAELGEGELEQARELVRGALELPQVSPEQRALGDLRALQLAALASDRSAVRALWEEARETLAADATLDGRPALALAALSAAPFLSDEDRAAARVELELAWAEGRLALPAGEARVSVRGVALAAELDALRDALRSLAPERAPSPELARWLLAARVDALASAAGGLASPSDGVAVTSTPAGLLCVEREGDLVRARLLDAASAAEALRASVRAAAILPPGFALDLGDAAEEGEAVSERVALAGSELAFVLRCADPGALARSERRRALALRCGFALMALLAAGASTLSFRALRRERRLQELKSTFVASVGHELRSPLASILLMAENLESKRVTDDAARSRYHAQMRKEAQRLRRLVEDVLDVARLERGRAPSLRLDEIELGAFARELADEARTSVEEEGGRLDVELLALPERARIDAEALRRCVHNLIENGLRHGGGELAMRIEARGGELAIELRDRGPGIPRSEREHVFEPFARLNGARATRGTGLGLAIARGVARAHGGELEARDPSEGPGVVLALRVPLEARVEGEA